MPDSSAAGARGQSNLVLLSLFIRLGVEILIQRVKVVNGLYAIFSRLLTSELQRKDVNVYSNL